MVVGAAGLAVAASGLTAASFVPAMPAAAPGLPIGWNVVGATWGLMRMARVNPRVWRALIGLSFFWGLGATFLTLFAVLVRDVFGGDNRVVTLLLTGFVVGVALGSLLGARVLRGQLRLWPVFWAGLAVGGLTALFVLLCMGPWARGWTTPWGMLGSLSGLLTLLSLLGTAAAGGVFALPLNASLQVSSAPADRARMVAANNVMNALWMMGSAVGISVLSAVGMGPLGILLLASGLSLVVAAWFRGVD